MRYNRTILITQLIFWVPLAFMAGCALLKDIARTADDVADIACELFGQEHPEEFEHLVRTVLPPGATSDAEESGFNPAILCDVKEVIQPFIDDQLRLQQSTRAGLRAGMNAPQLE